MKHTIDARSPRGFHLFNLAATFLAAIVLLSFIGLHSPPQSLALETSPEPASWPHLDSDLDPSPEIVFGELDNGIRYVIMENAKPENRVSMHLNVQVGSYHEAENERGIAHFLEHMLFLGSENFEPGELVKYFQRIGMRFGPDVNARTGFFQTIYDIDLPDANPDGISEALLVLRDYAAGGLIPEAQVNRERPVILAEKRTRDSPSYRTFKEALAFGLPGTRVIERLPIGTREVIEASDRDLLKSFYDVWYRPENLVVVVVGDLDAATAEKLISQRFSDITPRAPAREKPEFGYFGHTGVKPFYHHEPETGGTRVSIEVLLRENQPGDTIAYRRNRLLEQMGNQIVTHRLNNILNQPDAPFTIAAIYSGYYLGHARSATITAQCAPGQWETALETLEKTLRKALVHGFYKSELDRVKREITAQLRRAAKAAPTRESRDIARQFLNDLNQDHVLLLGDATQALLQPMVDAATLEQVNNAFREAWSPEHRLVMVTGNLNLEAGETPPEQKILSVYKESLDQEVEAPPETEAASFPYLETPVEPGAAASREHIDDLGITRVLFENGVTLLVKKTDFKTNEVLASLRFGDGRRSEPANNDGLSELAAQVVNLSGLGAMDREQLTDALAGTNTNVSFSVEEDAFSFSGRSVTDETSLLFELLYAHVEDPAYRETAYSRAIRQLEEQYESLSHAIEGGFQLKGRRFLAGGDTRFGLPDFETLAANEQSDIENWIESQKLPSGMEIAVVGDIDQDEVTALAAAFFGTLPTEPGPDIVTVGQKEDRNPVFPEKGRLKHPVPTRMERAMLMVAYPTTDIRDIRTTRRLSLLSDIFSDRMRIRIRDELGASYSQGSSNMPSRAYDGYGVFSAYASIDPGMTEKIKAEIKNIADDIRKNGISEEELERAVKPSLAGITSQLKTNTYWLNSVLRGASRHPAQIDWSRTIFTDYASMKPGEIHETARTFLKNDIAASMVFYPAERGIDEAGHDDTADSTESQGAK